ncbi:DUF805 domain-containing protein [Sporolactobacillus sp. CPB3-1]|uniref:DUF805 domain-containing protein n=1 Tax=Sporolactobacillus mangiferae TaxID=2940498 RepID=A0ABT0MCJ8_9BACL|nr:DUF805 domain-containing protein [Sporolactobacillus mangiferae]MCL1632583.1 DUF805 domain-containing protein [Sporolactobacillus mangiferae]
MNWYIDVIKNYAVFSGRATRMEYWMFTLFNVIFSVAAMLIDHFILNGLRLTDTLYTLAVLVPGLAVGARRLHDIGRTGWWQLIAFIPLLGAIVLLIFFCTDSQDKTNKYGPDPKELTI